MKKLILSMVAVSTMLAAGAANAAQTPYSKQFDFSGTITSLGPVWQWSIPAASVQQAKDWSFEKDSGVVSGKNTVYSINKAAIPFVQGLMQYSVDNSAPGFSPKLSIAGVDMGFAVSKALTVDISNKGEKLGKLGFTASDAAILIDTDPKVLFVGTPPKMTALQQTAWSLLTPAVASYKKKYATLAAGEAHHGLENVVAKLSGRSGWGVMSNMTASIVTDLGGFTLTFPTAKIPSVWTATVPATITYS